MERYRLIDIAKVIRSKNSGPYELTFDIIFKSQEIFEKITSKKLVTPEIIGELYKVDPRDVSIVEFFPASAIKATIPRPIPSGDVAETDVYGAQQHGPLLKLELPMEG
jgi:hypothetical protein